MKISLLEELDRVDTALTQAATEQRRLELTERIDRLREHIERVGPSPGIQAALDKAEAELQALGQSTP